MGEERKTKVPVVEIDSRIEKPTDSMTRAIAANRSFTGPLILIISLYISPVVIAFINAGTVSMARRWFVAAYFLMLPAMVAAFAYKQAANEAEKLAGRKLLGVREIRFIATVQCFVMPILGLFAFYFGLGVLKVWIAYWLISNPN